MDQSHLSDNRYHYPMVASSSGRSTNEKPVHRSESRHGALIEGNYHHSERASTSRRKTKSPPSYSRKPESSTFRTPNGRPLSPHSDGKRGASPPAAPHSWQRFMSPGRTMYKKEIPSTSQSRRPTSPSHSTKSPRSPPPSSRKPRSPYSSSGRPRSPSPSA